MANLIKVQFNIYTWNKQSNQYFSSITAKAAHFFELAMFSFNCNIIARDTQCINKSSYAFSDSTQSQRSLLSRVSSKKMLEGRREQAIYMHSCGTGEQIAASVKAGGKTKICKPCNWYMDKSWHKKLSHSGKAFSKWYWEINLYRWAPIHYLAAIAILHPPTVPSTTNIIHLW